MQTTLTLQVTEVEFDFDDLDFTPEEQQEVVDYALGNTFEVEVDDANDECEVADALAECVTDLTNWCVVSLNYRNVTSITNCNMNLAEWNQLYSKLYDAYSYSANRDEQIRKNLGEMLDYMIEYDRHFLKRPA